LSPKEHTRLIPQKNLNFEQRRHFASKPDNFQSPGFSLYNRATPNFTLFKNQLYWKAEPQLNILVSGGKNVSSSFPISGRRHRNFRFFVLFVHRRCSFGGGI
jgi:hypothetical protein